MRVSESQLRTVTLAQAIEHADGQHTLVSLPERQDALRSALASARARGVVRATVADVVLERAATVVERAQARDAGVERLRTPSARLRWLARLAPLVALLLGLWLDRIGNAHRVDLLSPPLLAVLLWNGVTYGLLVLRAWGPWRTTAPGALLRAVHQWGHRATARGGRRSLTARIAADFHTRWWARTAPLFTVRAARVLHLCAAGWAAGIALSLLLRGLVVRYQFGWESTFLNAEQVHALVSALFLPLTALFGLAPFTLQEIAAAQNFAGEAGGAAGGGRWVSLYVGLLVLVVVLPRLALAAWSRWRESREVQRCALELNAPEWEGLRAELPGDLVVGMVGLASGQWAAWRAIVASQTSLDPSSWPVPPGSAAHPGAPAPHQTGVLRTAVGDSLRFVEMDAGGPGGAVRTAGPPDFAAGPTAFADATALETIDAVLVWDAPATPGPQPAVWQPHSREVTGRTGPPVPGVSPVPLVHVRWADMATSWVQESTLFIRLEAALPAQRAVLQRLHAVWNAHNEARFGQSMALLAQYLEAGARRAPGDEAADMQALLALDAALLALHPRTIGGGVEGNGRGSGNADGDGGVGDAGHSAPDSPGAPSGVPLEAPVSSGGWNPLALARSATHNAGMVLGTTAGATAGAAAGAKLGALVDVGTGGLTLGAGTALGAALGGAGVWLVDKLRRQGTGPFTGAGASVGPAGQGAALLRVEEAMAHYLGVAHQGRLAGGGARAEALAGRWRAEITGTVAAHSERLLGLLPPGSTGRARRDNARAEQNDSAPADALQPLLETMLRGILRRSALPQTPAPSPTQAQTPAAPPPVPAVSPSSLATDETPASKAAGVG